MNPRVAHLLIVFILCSSIQGAFGATAKIDDSGTSLESITRMYWRQIVPSRTPDNLMEGLAQVSIRLNLTQWLGRSGRIYMVLPEQQIGQVKLAWPTNGRFQSGILTSGQRTLIYGGQITSSIMEGILSLKIEVDGTRLDALQRLNFNFEIDSD